MTVSLKAARVWGEEGGSASPRPEEAEVGVPWRQTRLKNHCSILLSWFSPPSLLWLCWFAVASNSILCAFLLFKNVAFRSAYDTRGSNPPTSSSFQSLSYSSHFSSSQLHAPPPLALLSFPFFCSKFFLICPKLIGKQYFLKVSCVNIFW